MSFVAGLWQILDAAHEIGYVSGPQDATSDHLEAGLMEDGLRSAVENFTPKTVRRFRNSTKWRD
jgi:hypothetical protein